MLTLQRARQQSRSPTEAARIEGRIKLVDEKIDDSVYRLYGLTTTEATMIEAHFDQ